MCNGVDCVAAPLTAAAGDWFDEQVTTLATWVGTKLIGSATWWMTGSTIDPNSASVIKVQQVLVPISILIMTLAVMWQAARMMISRKPAPLVDVVSGLVRYCAVSVAGLAVWEAVIALADYATGHILDVTKQDFATKLGLEVTALVGATAPTSGGGSVIALLLVVVLLLLASLVQFVLAFIRLAGIEVLAVLLPLAAAGSLTQATRPWLRKLNSWFLALVTYKPIAAVIYLLGFDLLVGPMTMPKGTPADIQTLSRTMIGLMVLVLAVACLPIMMKFFAIFGADTSGGGVAGAVLGAGAVAAGAVKLTGMLGGGASSAADRMQASGPASGPGPTAGPAALPPGGGGPPPPPPPPPPGSPAQGNGAPSPSTGSPGAPSASPPSPGPTPSPAPNPAAGSAPGPVPAAAQAGSTAAGAGTAATGAAVGAATGGLGTAAMAAGAAARQAGQHASQQAQQFGGQPPTGPTGGSQ